MELPEYITIMKGSVHDLWSPIKEEPTDMVVEKVVLEIPSAFKLYREYVPQYHAVKVTFECQYDGKKHGHSMMIPEEDLGDLNINILQNFIDHVKEGLFKQYPDMHEKVKEIFSARLTDQILKMEQDYPVSTHYANGGLILNGPVKVKTETPSFYASAAISEKSKKLPGVSAKVDYPCSCGGTAMLWSAVQHLNDAHEDWNREKIADWIDELHDAGIINAEFQPWNEDAEDEAVENFKWADVDIDPEALEKHVQSLLEKAKEPVFDQKCTPVVGSIKIKSLDKEGKPAGGWIDIGMGTISMGPFSLQNEASAGTHNSGGVIDLNSDHTPYGVNLTTNVKAATKSLKELEKEVSKLDDKLSKFVTAYTKYEPVPTGEQIMENLKKLQKKLKEKFNGNKD